MCAPKKSHTNNRHSGAGDRYIGGAEISIKVFNLNQPSRNIERRPFDAATRRPADLHAGIIAISKAAARAIDQKTIWTVDERPHNADPLVHLTVGKAARAVNQEILPAWEGSANPTAHRTKPIDVLPRMSEKAVGVIGVGDLTQGPAFAVEVRVLNVGLQSNHPPWIKLAIIADLATLRGRLSDYLRC